MATDELRRRLLLSLSLAGAGLVTAPVRGNGLIRGPDIHDAGAPATWPQLLCAWQTRDAYFAGAWSVTRGARGVALPLRAHQVIADSTSPDHAIVIARRPGDYICRFDTRSLEIRALREADAERFFEGHAAFSADGRTLFTTETDVASGRGIVGVRDSETLVKQTEFPTYGVGPHALMMEEAGTLLVANGGILTLPETGRIKLNLEHMDSSLVRVNTHDGTLVGQWRLSDPRLSIRHLAGYGDCVGLALQAEHEDAQERSQAPVFACFDGNRLCVGEMPGRYHLAGYGGDIACIESAAGTQFAISCPRAGMLAWWDANARWQGSVALAGVCGVVRSGSRVATTSEAGEVTLVTPATAIPIRRLATPIRFDNHVAAMDHVDS